MERRERERERERERGPGEIQERARGGDDLRVGNDLVPIIVQRNEHNVWLARQHVWAHGPVLSSFQGLGFRV